jgi:hypothetical protein
LISIQGNTHEHAPHVRIHRRSADHRFSILRDHLWLGFPTSDYRKYCGQRAIEGRLNVLAFALECAAAAMLLQMKSVTPLLQSSGDSANPKSLPMQPNVHSSSQVLKCSP